MTTARLAARRAAGALLALVLAGCGAPEKLPRIDCLGDSITLGITRAGRGLPPDSDPEGGYPGRLAHRLGGRAEVIGRGVGGATTAFWLTDPQVGVGRTMWGALVNSGHGMPGAPPAGAQTVALAVLLADRPDVVIIFLGANDLYFARGHEGPGVIVEILDRLDLLETQARAHARVVLVSTVLPSHRDPAQFRDALNAGIRTRHPDALPLAERFAAADWESLLGDEIHPNEKGYELIAATLAEELERRGVVSAPSTRR